MIKFKRTANTILTGGFVLLLLALPLLPVPPFWIIQANYIGMAALVTIGVVLLTGIGGMTSFGQAAFAGIGAYTTAYLTTAAGMSPWLTLLIGLLLTAICATLLGWITLRMSGHYLPLATIAWGISLYFLFGKVSWLGMYDGLSGIPAIPLADIDFKNEKPMFYLIWTVLLAAIWLMSNLLNSRSGRAIRALKGGRLMAESMGVNTGHYKILIFVLAALLAALSGWLFAHFQRSVNPSPFGIKMGIEYLFMAVIGGAGSLWGAVLGSTILQFIGDHLQVILPKLFGGAGNYEGIVFGVILILLLKYSPQGLWSWLTGLFAGIFPAVEVKLALDHAGALTRRTPPAAGSALLQLERVSKRFGGLVAVNNISFELKAGEIVGLIGPNGAGKSTTFNLVTGLLPPSEGSIRFLGHAIGGLPSRAIATRGIARTFQHVQLMPAMSVLENVAIGAHQRGAAGALRAMLHLERTEEARLLQEAARCLTQVGLQDLMYEQAGSLPLGKQRIMEIARALCCDPVLLLLDEPAAGLRYQEKQDLAQVLQQLRADGMSILLVEHDMGFVMQLTDHIVVMEFGTKIAEGTPRAIQQNPAVITAYLGGEA